VPDLCPPEVDILQQQARGWPSCCAKPRNVVAVALANKTARIV
jgi:hypothetical protein